MLHAEDGTPVSHRYIENLETKVRILGERLNDAMPLVHRGAKMEAFLRDMASEHATEEGPPPDYVVRVQKFLSSLKESKP